MNIIINPGSGPVETGAVEQSEINIKKFIEDCSVSAKYKFIKIEENGRHLYKVWNNKHSHEISMPAIPLEKVRFLGEAGQNIWHYPRLYVDGSSWVWEFAVSVSFKDDED